jgi:hypothetical protein
MVRSGFYAALVPLLFVAVVRANLDLVPAWTVNGTILGAPHFHPTSGGVLCYGFTQFDSSTQQPQCVFFNADTNQEFARTESFPFSFLEVISRFPEVLPVLAMNDGKANVFINQTCTVVCCSFWRQRLEFVSGFILLGVVSSFFLQHSLHAQFQINPIVELSTLRRGSLFGTRRTLRTKSLCFLVTTKRCKIDMFRVRDENLIVQSL